MKKKFIILRQDVEAAEKFRKALEKCRFENSENCIFVPPDKNHRCLKCEIAVFKSEIILNAQPFLEAWKKILAFNYFSARERRLALSHIFLGIGALYSLNQRKVPIITDALVNEINQKAGENIDELEFLHEVKDDLKGLGYDWYEKFYSVWADSHLTDKIWFGNILLLKIFLEAMRIESSDPKKSKEPIPGWKSEEEKKQLTDEVLDFLHKESKKNK